MTARPTTVFPVWSGTTSDGRCIAAYVAASISPSNPVFQWEVHGKPPSERRQLTRPVNGDPARVLTYVEDTPSQASEEPVGWVDPPERQDLDEAGELVRVRVDGSGVDELLAVARELAAQDVDMWREKISSVHRYLEHALEWSKIARVMAAALDFDTPMQRDVALRLADDCSGTGEDFVQTVRDGTA